ncbi:MAG TPA: DnaA regulatory inactivator Hda [Gammaproteobacteria bacterium]
MRPQQLALRVGLRDGITFDNFLPAGNEALLHQLIDGDEPFIYLWGQTGSGKSHLLHALCQAANEKGVTAVHLGLAEYRLLDVAIFDGIEQFAVVTIDDVDAIGGVRQWEEALFHLYNRCRDSGARLVVSATNSPANAGFQLPDLISRLGWGPVYQLQALNDNGKAAALQLRARRRGMELPDDVATYLLKHSTRDLPGLFTLLDELDQASLTAKRRLTVPFVRELLRRTSTP